MLLRAKPTIQVTFQWLHFTKYDKAAIRMATRFMFTRLAVCIC